MKVHVQLAVVLAFFLGCGAQQGPAPVPPPPPPDDVDAGPGEAGARGDLFDKACANLRKHGCSEGFDRPGETSCAATMRRAETEKLTEMHPDCVRAAASLTALRACGRYCKTVVPSGTQ